MKITAPPRRPSRPSAWRPLGDGPAEPTVELRPTDCLLCGSSRWSTLLQAPDFDDPTGPCYNVVRCRECGLCYTNPRPAPGDMDRFYRPDYRPHRTSHETPRRGALGRRWLRAAVQLGRRRPEKERLAPHGHCRLLDFGCGSGAFLQHMHEAGWEVSGLDLSEGAVRRVRNELGLDAMVGTLPHPDLPPESFDLVTMWQSLEHVHQPLEVLRAAHQLLSPGGRLIVAVPNIDSGPYRWFGPAWFGLDLPRHLTHFSAAALRQMLAQAGFRVEKVRMVRHTTWLQRSARRASGHRCGVRRSGWLTVRPICRLASLYCLLTGQSDCITATAVRRAVGDGLGDANVQALGAPVRAERQPGRPAEIPTDSPHGS